uniref:VHS domain-containing protein n=1 Tax=Aegilops tauschii subsp. strangulata TaxID=200361 RepID=A0A453HJV2_AEGTS
REKILSLIDTWQVAFGGPSGRYPQYHTAYQELRGSWCRFSTSRGEYSSTVYTSSDSTFEAATSVSSRSKL